MKRVHLLISGDVQGVGFRHATRQCARPLGVVGWVRNLPTGQVEVVAEGEPGPLDRLIDWAKVGPRSARVDDVQIEWAEATGEFGEFSIAH